VGNAAFRNRRTHVAIIALSLVAISVGLLATAISARSLRPVGTLIEAVTRIGRGDYRAQLKVRGDDEIAQLARAFDGMARSLQEREALLKEQQEALLRAEQLAAVGRVSAQIAHEVRNPLSSIGLNMELLEEAFEKAQFGDEQESREAKEILASVLREVDRLTEVTEHYLRMARMPKPSLAAEDLNEVLESVLDFSREELERSRVEVVRNLDPAGPKAMADEGQLRQVFLNLLRNSRDAMRERGGRLTVESRQVNGSVEVVFQDTGRGMTPEVQRRIFEPFFSTKDNGTGLGLAVSQQILQAHGGTIDCRSAPGSGTTFTVRLPHA
jgi:two-component system, NtrC family, sensor kinase